MLAPMQSCLECFRELLWRIAWPGFELNFESPDEKVVMTVNEAVTTYRETL